jgi:hypothetical protein
MFVSKKHLPRRTVLRGIGGTVIALPFLDAMVPALTAQSQTAAARPLRFGAVYWPHGTLPVNWAPGTATANFEFPRVLKPLEPFRDQLTVVSGLTNPQPGGHTTASSMFLNNSRPKRTQGQDVSADVTVDQMIADTIAGDTTFRSLELGTEDMSGSLGICGGLSCLYLSVLSWKTKTTPLPMDINPRVLFERMFGDAGSPSGRVSRIGYRRSLLDAITKGAQRLETRVGPADRQMISDYLDNIREIERQLQAAERRVATNPDVPAAPPGIPESYDVHVKLMYDLAALAFRADLTRVVTFMTAHEGSQRAYTQIGVTEGHHSISHHREDAGRIEQYTKIGQHQCEAFAKFIETLRSTPDGDGTLLDHSMIMYGSGMSNANEHSPVDLPNVVVGGACGRIAGNRHLRQPEGSTHGNLLVALAQKAGVELNQLGMSTGVVAL